jgi:hypothetical protein
MKAPCALTPCAILGLLLFLLCDIIKNIIKKNYVTRKNKYRVSCPTATTL